MLKTIGLLFCQTLQVVATKIAGMSRRLPVDLAKILHKKLQSLNGNLEEMFEPHPRLVALR